MKSDNVDIIIFGAHPDDQEMAMGGTMIKLAKAGYKILNVSLTPSDMSTYGDVKQRKKEFEAAAAFVGCESLMLDFQDTRVENTPDNRVTIARIIRQRKPKIIFAPYHTNNLADMGGIANVDHYTTGALVRDAVKIARLEKTVPDVEKHTIQKLFFYMLPRNITPSIMVDVSGEIEGFKKLIDCYQTQKQISFRDNNIEEILLTMRKSLGMFFGVAYAEGFVCDMPLNFSANHFLES